MGPRLWLGLLGKGCIVLPKDKGLLAPPGKLTVSSLAEQSLQLEDLIWRKVFLGHHCQRPRLTSSGADYR